MVSSAPPKERLSALAAVVALHALFACALLLGFAPTFLRQAEERLTLVNIVPDSPPPPMPEINRPAQSSGPKAAAAPANLRAEPKAIFAPRLATTRTNPAAPIAGSGSRASAGMAERPGSGTGGGGEGAGRGSGGAGGGVTVRAQLRSGSILPRDYPRAANGQQGIVTAQLNVSAAGIVTSCSIAQSSGNAVLDAATCRLIRERFRFAPARDSQGNAVPDVKGWQQRWWRE